jgi:aspartyl-tRNA(Asn)/glutamyl-tRNA(Gln) amidotransferase subunit A
MPNTVSERTAACLDATARLNPALKGMITVNPAAMEDAAIADTNLDAGLLPAAGGIIVSVKDNIDTSGLRTTMGSSFFADHVPNADAEVVQRLRRAGCVIIGKANLHEFAFGGTTQNPHHGAARNPWNPDAIPGGSSGGSGSTVAAGMCEVSLGTDTGGSIRIPAALNGVVGLRPSVGRVPNTGSFPVSAAYDTIGPLARTVTAVAAVYEVIAGYDPADDVSVDCPVESFSSRFSRGISGLRIGIPEAWCLADIDPDIERLVRAAISVLRDLGCTVSKIDLPEAAAIQGHLLSMVQADGAAVHASRLADAPEKFGADVLERLRLGQAVTSRAYADAMRARERWLRRLDGVFSDIDVIVTPTCPTPAPFIANSARMIETTRGISRFTYAWSMAGVPALSVPCGFTGRGLPGGLQLVGPRFEEARILALGAHYQLATDFHRRRPPA